MDLQAVRDTLTILGATCKQRKLCLSGMPKKSIAIIFATLISLPYLVLGQQINPGSECERTYANGTTVYLACVGLAEQLYLLRVDPKVEPEYSTCGQEDLDRSIYCTLDFDFRCSICNASNETLAHPPEYMYDPQLSLADPTWWQSISWYDYPIPLEVNITLSLNHTYKLDGDITLTFQSGRPQLMVLEKSSDYGHSWDVYQYFARDCSDFGMVASRPYQLTDPTEIICSEDYSGSLPRSGGEVVFDVVRRYDQALSNNTDFHEFLSITDLRIRLIYPATDGLEWSGQEQNLVKYYYAVSNIEVFLICDCNNHAGFCRESDSGGITCECQHNTVGKNCEQCLPLYNDRPWQMGSIVDVNSQTGPANECKKCNCNGHALSCTYNATLQHGVCNECDHNTTGLFCEICTSGFYPNMSIPIESENRCVECFCNALGTEEGSEACDQLPDNGQVVGQCPCKTNVTGRACDRCIDGFYGLTSGECRECMCDVYGTVNGSMSCDQQTGVCVCKETVTGLSCDQCKDEFFQFPSDVQSNCLPCGCDPGASQSLVCDKESGNCDCRDHLFGLKCHSVETNFFVPSLNYISFDAWSATSSCLTQVDSARNDFTGRGYLRCSGGDVVIFSNISVVETGTSYRSYWPAVRYSYTGTNPWNSIILTVTASHNASVAGNMTLCPYYPEDVVYSASELTFETGSGLAWIAQSHQALYLSPWCIYSAQLTFSSEDMGGDTMDVDSLLFLPVPNNFTVFQLAGLPEQVFFENCLKVSASISSQELSLTDTCASFGFSLMTELFDGALSCNCHPEGSLFAYCLAGGGQCFCKPGVGGRRCDHCLPAFYDFGPEGCTACNCSETNSISQACDYITGQCPCKNGVAEAGQENVQNLIGDLQCGSCLVNHYPSADGEGCLPCNCSQEGSLNLQCDDDGICSCKDTIGGDKCDMCLPGFYAFSADGCLSCDCNDIGSNSEVCHQVDGSCSCKANVVGFKCNLCSPGTFNLQSDNPRGCQECFCFGHSDQCDSAPNFVQETITSNFRLGSLDGWTVLDVTSLDMNSNNVRVSHPPSLPAGEFIYFSAPEKYLGTQIYSYGRSFIINMKLDTGSVSQPEAAFLKITGGTTNQVITYIGDTITPTDQISTFQALLYEDLWLVEGELRSPLSSEFYDILSDISTIQVRASYGVDTVTTFYSIAMETAQYKNSLQLADVLVESVEQCVCDSNTTGNSCQSCISGTFRYNLTGSQYNSCVPCTCNGRAQDCDADTGICLNCRLGTAGDHCEACAANVVGPDCDQCEADHYGFGTDLFDGACAACNCNISGTENTETQCDNESGQCPCKQNYGGRQCERCNYNYYDYEAGCLRCDVCYDSIQDRFTSILLGVEDLTSAVEALQGSGITTTGGSFKSRYEMGYDQFLLLVAETNKVEEELNNFEESVLELNSTMLSILVELDMMVREEVSEIVANQTQTEENIRMAEMAVNNVTLFLQLAYTSLNDGDLQSTTDHLRELTNQLAGCMEELNSTSQEAGLRVSSLTQQVEVIRSLTESALEASGSALQTVQMANSIHDNVTTYLASILAYTTSTSEQIQQLAINANRLKLRANATLLTIQGLVTHVGQQNLTYLEQRVEAVRRGLAETMFISTDVLLQIDTELQDRQALIDQVSNVQIETDILKGESGELTNSIAQLVNRTESANQRAAATLAESNKTFIEAEEQLRVVENFQNISSDSQRQALAASDEIAAVNQEAADAYSLAVRQREQLSLSASFAASGLGNASDAHQLVQEEAREILRLKGDAEMLEKEVASSFNSSEMKIDAIKNINETILQPIGEQCLTHAREVQTLEATASDLASQAEQASVETLNLLQVVNSLLQQLRDINQLENDQLEGLRVRLSQVSSNLTQADYEEAVRLMREAIDEQSGWIETTRLETEDMRSQIDALDSFRVN
ncbi:Laminin subunit beta-1 [Holothuria leucospilota]|uniref:Laminin subunit beta-1 n=1 Tax=Holothuria leucospilota TaxID=206669 RepID=A0A9Q1C553_HOLLE|nr:Laminin subunit beta-1 [Holothuria leucospilota]